MLLTRLGGWPYTFALVPASPAERVAAAEMLDRWPAAVAGWSAKGFMDAVWPAAWRTQDIRRGSAKRANQPEQNPPAFDRLLKRVRARIETPDDQLQAGGRSAQRT